MEDILFVVLEIVLLIAVGFPVAYLIWRMGSGRMTFGEYLNRYGEAIAVIALGILVLTYFLVAGFYS